MATQNLLELGITQSLSIFSELDLEEFYRALDLLTKKGISNREIARVVCHTEFSVRRWKQGMLPIDKTVILVVNRWAKSIQDSC